MTSNPGARIEELKAHEALCTAKLDSLNRMLHRLSPSDHMFGGVIRGIAKWSNEQARTQAELWDALSDMNSRGQASHDQPRLVVVN